MSALKEAVERLAEAIGRLEAAAAARRDRLTEAPLHAAPDEAVIHRLDAAIEHLQSVLDA